MSGSYLRQLRDMHARRAFANGGGLHAPGLRELIGKVQARTLLDYGCGQGGLRDALADVAIDVREYDPAVAGKDHPPGPADVVACIDVLEHVEPTKINAVLSHLRELTTLSAYVVIATRPAEKRLPDDRNAHLIIEPASWWVHRIRGAGMLEAVRPSLHEGELTLWLRPTNRRLS